MGAPQTAGLTLEYSLTPRFSLQAHGGWFVYFSSYGLRLNYYFSQKKLAPYIFVGDAVIHSRAEDYGDPHGTTNYLWLGPGIKLQGKKFAVFAEVCTLRGGDE